mmetsp:Transcript_18171/g.21753  ORF Transcript_18171/g.21753 Transcript_18171/m.21753 type:complete len:320 (+) Transcript_18171:132-1091(+)|eukprot:CAMPEP_0198268398 /NCGR_PEP_ID=MMETSP1447-20131203/37084_1 /TAXON_ID=420782 /ORGANISM="Chaetoceros dichaeta, Strain CCMP1751" /LENGTH=319 /DNA_ID=CAMNT_0043959427 /DNA_START=174 /DNA_END=1133 /DNA_ORIENTATION=+
MPHVELPQAEFKVVMLGDTNVGKTSLVLRFAEGYYRDEGRSATVGAFFITKRIQTSSGITCKVAIWDTAGQAKFRKIAPMYYRTAAAAIVCYDVSNPKSFEVMREWVDEIQNTSTSEPVAIVIAATKRDLADEPTTQTLIPTTKATEYAANVGAIFVDTSARTNDNVQLLFRRVSERVLELRELARNNGQLPHRDGVGGVVGGGVGSSSALLVTPPSTRTLEGGATRGGGAGNILGTGVGGGDIAAGGSGGRGREMNTNRALSDNYGEGEQNSPKDTSTLSVDELEESMAEETLSRGLCTTFGCTASEDKTDESQCIIM